MTSEHHGHDPHEPGIHGAAAADDHDGAHAGFGKYAAVTVALVVLTGISFTAGSSPAVMNTPQVGWTIMLAVSCCKALLVMLFFMHLLWEANWKYVLRAPQVRSSPAAGHDEARGVEPATGRVVPPAH
jgi:cytochrome c oxidase subunit 4